MLSLGDFQTLKLENGLRLWQPLWDYRQPDIPCFSTPVKPQRNVLKAQRSLLKVNTNAANIYIGKGTSRENLHFPFDLHAASSRKSSMNETVASPRAPLVRMPDICPSITTESQSVEVICEHCNTVVTSRGAVDCQCQCGRRESYVAFSFDSRMPSIPVMQSSVDSDFVRQRLASAVTSGIRGSESPDILSASYFDIAVIRCLFCLHWSEDGVFWALRYIQQRLLEVCDEFLRRDYTDRERSRSLPFPDLALLKKQSNPFAEFDRKYGIHAPLYRKQHTFQLKAPQLATIPSTGEISPTDLTKGKVDGKKEPAFKRSRVGEKKQFYYPVGTEDQTSTERPRFTLYDDPSSPPGHRVGNGQLTSSPSPTDSGLVSQARLNDKRGGVVRTEKGTGDHHIKLDAPGGGATQATSPGQKSVSFPSPLIADSARVPGRGKYGTGGFTATAKLIGQDRESMESSSHASSSSSNTGDSAQGDKKKGGGPQGEEGSGEDVQKPIITVTEHGQERRDRMSAMLYRNLWTPEHGTEAKKPEDKNRDSGLPRSRTDTDISYHHEEDVHEVPGSLHYIQDNGHLNYKVILGAVHFIAINQASTRNQSTASICEVGHGNQSATSICELCQIVTNQLQV